MAAAASPDQIYRAISAAVDPAFYRAAYPDLGAFGNDPVRHYVRLGWREGRDPAPWFSTDDYLDRCPDVAEAGLNPLHHYLTLGRGEGREVRRSILAAAYVVAGLPGADQDWDFVGARLPPVSPMSPRSQVLTAEERALVAGAFDEAFYLSANPDVAALGASALDHFLRVGWREDRDPNDDFSVADYLEANSDVAAEGINPFLHYLKSGAAQGRAPRNALGFRYPIVARLESPDVRMAKAAAASADVALSPPARLAAALAESRGGGLHVTLSHDDYTANVGGVQLCLQREAAAMAGRDRDHLHLFPVAPWPMLRRAGEAAPLGVVWNGGFVGAFAPEAVGAAVAGRGANGSFAIHSLLGHSVDEVTAILTSAGLRAGYFWLHDFASLCAGYHLLRNDVADCGAPPPSSPACSICVYGPHRARHLEAHEALFAALELTVVAPSESALATWRAGWRYPAKAEIVAPHARLVEAGPAPAARPGPLRIAFLGWGSPLKGWPVFRNLARKYAADRRYAFLHLGQHARSGLPILFHEVAVTAERPLAMRDAIARLNIDVALIWPLCRETFSFTAYEAVSGGAAILTSPDSGNVAAFVRETGHGRVLADEAALDALLASGKILKLARAVRRPNLYDLVYGAMSGDLLGRPSLTGRGARSRQRPSLGPDPIPNPIGERPSRTVG